MREVFQSAYQASYGPWSALSGQFILNLSGILCLDDRQEELVKGGDIGKWDVTLLAALLRFSVVAGRIGKDLKKRIKDLVDSRNKLAHFPTHYIPESDWVVLFPETKAVLLSLGSPPKNIQDVLEGNISLLEVPHFFRGHRRNNTQRALLYVFRGSPRDGLGSSERCAHCCVRCCACCYGRCGEETSSTRCKSPCLHLIIW